MIEMTHVYSSVNRGLNLLFIDRAVDQRHITHGLRIRLGPTIVIA